MIWFMSEPTNKN